MTFGLRDSRIVHARVSRATLSRSVRVRRVYSVCLITFNCKLHPARSTAPLWSQVASRKSVRPLACGGGMVQIL